MVFTFMCNFIWNQTIASNIWNFILDLQEFFTCYLTYTTWLWGQYAVCSGLHREILIQWHHIEIIRFMQMRYDSKLISWHNCWYSIISVAIYHMLVHFYVPVLKGCKSFWIFYHLHPFCTQTLICTIGKHSISDLSSC